MRIVPTFIGRLAHVVLTGELTTRREFKEMYRDHPFIQEAAYRAFSRDAHVPRYMQEQAMDSLVIAEAVWFDYMRPHIKKMLVDKWGADEQEAEKTIDRYFIDDSPTWDPNPRRPRRG